MNTPASICAIIPTYNRAAFLQECLDSILAQSRPLHQIIVVNDGSTDNTEEIVRAYGDRITLLTKQNGGKSSALNLGLQYCQSDYVWICDDDDIALPDGLRHLAEELDRDPSLDLVFGKYQVFKDTKQGRILSESLLWAREGEPNYKICFMESMFTNQFAMLVRHSLYKEVGPFNEAMLRSQDYEMTMRLTRFSKIKCIPELIYSYREHLGERGTNQFRFNAKKSNQNWYTFDKRAWQDVLKNYSLDEFTPSFALYSEEKAKRRAQLIQRGLLAANHGLWDQAASDYEAASDMAVGEISQEELTLLTAYVHNAFAFYDLINTQQTTRRFNHCYKKNRVGHTMVHATFHHLTWKAKNALLTRDIKGAMIYAQLLLKILGVSGSAKRIFESLSLNKLPIFSLNSPFPGREVRSEQD